MRQTDGLAIGAAIVAAPFTGGLRWFWGSPWDWGIYLVIYVFFFVFLYSVCEKVLIEENLAELGADLDSLKKNTQSQSNAPIEVEPQSLKICPFCAEEIKAAAIVCKHCGKDV